MRATLKTTGLMLMPDARILADLAPDAARNQNELAALSMLAQLPLIEQTTNMDLRLPAEDLAAVAQVSTLFPLIALAPYIESKDAEFWDAIETLHQRTHEAFQEVMKRIARYVYDQQELDQVNESQVSP